MDLLHNEDEVKALTSRLQEAVENPISIPDWEYLSQETQRILESVERSAHKHCKKTAQRERRDTTEGLEPRKDCQLWMPRKLKRQYNTHLDRSVIFSEAAEACFPDGVQADNVSPAEINTFIKSAIDVHPSMEPLHLLPRQDIKHLFRKQVRIEQDMMSDIIRMYRKKREKTKSGKNSTKHMSKAQMAQIFADPLSEPVQEMTWVNHLKHGPVADADLINEQLEFHFRNLMSPKVPAPSQPARLGRDAVNIKTSHNHTVSRRGALNKASCKDSLSSAL